MLIAVNHPDRTSIDAVQQSIDGGVPRSSSYSLDMNQLSLRPRNSLPASLQSAQTTTTTRGKRMLAPPTFFPLPGKRPAPMLVAGRGDDSDNGVLTCSAKISSESLMHCPHVDFYCTFFSVYVRALEAFG